MIIMISREIPPPKLPIKIGLDQIDEETVGVTILEAGVGVEGGTIVGGITLIGGTVGAIVVAIVDGVLVGVGVTVGAGGGVEIVAAGASGGLVAISFVELPSETTV